MICGHLEVKPETITFFSEKLSISSNNLMHHTCVAEYYSRRRKCRDDKFDDGSRNLLEFGGSRIK